MGRAIFASSVFALTSLTASLGCRAVQPEADAAETNAVEMEGTGGAALAGMSDPQTLLHAATVTVEDRCAGVVVENGEHAVTAAHCIHAGERSVRLTYVDGTSVLAEVKVIDRTQDVAILELGAPPPVEGLPIADELPRAGTPAYFAGRPDRGTELQDVTIERLGKCPTLPGVPAALFTSMRGVPGDSGAPVVDEFFQVIGLVHGGAACSVAAPTAEVPQMLETLSAEIAANEASSAGETAGEQRPAAGRARSVR